MQSVQSADVWVESTIPPIESNNNNYVYEYMSLTYIMNGLFQVSDGVNKSPRDI